LISLASQAPKVLPIIAFSGDSTFADGRIVQIIGFVAGGFVMLFSFWFFCISTVAVIAGIRQMSFTLNWWAFIFPNAGLTLAVIELGKVYNSPGINWVASVLTILLVVMWIIVVIANIRAVLQKKILWPGKDEDGDMEV
jgi:tellurite resistance protein TehA-like permease